VKACWVESICLFASQRRTGVGPGEDPLPEGAFAFSWALVLQHVNNRQYRLYIRLRGKREGKSFAWPLFLMGGPVDYVTIAFSESWGTLA
jgi:hypothetical protein